MIVYKIPGPNRGPKGITYAWRGLDEGSDIPDGWYDSLTGAIEAQSEPPKRKRRTKAEMEADKEEDS